MTPYAIQVGDLTQEDLIALKVADDLLNMPELTDDLTCHDIVKIWKQGGGSGEIRTGWWFKHEHSWIELRPGVILDIYPVAQVRPLLIYTDTLMLRQLYETKEQREWRRKHG